MAFNVFVFFYPFKSVVKCPSIAKPSNGMVVPSTCQIPSGVNHKTQCLFMCNVTIGYHLEGAPKVSCLESGSWSDDPTKTICRGNKHCVLRTIITTKVKVLSTGYMLLLFPGVIKKKELALFPGLIFVDLRTRLRKSGEYCKKICMETFLMQCRMEN